MEKATGAANFFHAHRIGFCRAGRRLRLEGPASAFDAQCCEFRVQGSGFGNWVCGRVERWENSQVRAGLGNVAQTIKRGKHLRWWETERTMFWAKSFTDHAVADAGTSARSPLLGALIEPGWSLHGAWSEPTPPLPHHYPQPITRLFLHPFSIISSSFPHRPPAPLALPARQENCIPWRSGSEGSRPESRLKVYTWFCQMSRIKHGR